MSMIEEYEALQMAKKKEQEELRQELEIKEQESIQEEIKLNALKQEELASLMKTEEEILQEDQVNSENVTTEEILNEDAKEQIDNGHSNIQSGDTEKENHEQTEGRSNERKLKYALWKKELARV